MNNELLGRFPFTIATAKGLIFAVTQPAALYNGWGGDKCKIELMDKSYDVFKVDLAVTMAVKTH